MNPYNIDDLIDQDACDQSAYEATGKECNSYGPGVFYEGTKKTTCGAQSAEPKTNKKTMNFIEQNKLDKFLKGKKVETLEKNVDAANEINITFTNVASSLQNIVSQINGNNLMLGDAIDRADLAAIEAISAELETQIEIVNEPEFADAVEVIAKMLGAKSSAKKADKKAVAKGLGFVTKEKAAK